MAIIIIDNFQVDINNPIDNRFVVGSQSIPSGSPSLYPTPFYPYKEDIIYKYPGLRIWDFNDNTPYFWNGTQWINENTTGALVENAATGNTGFINYLAKFKNNQTLLTKGLVYDTGTHIGIGLTGSSIVPGGVGSFGLHVAGNIKTNGGFVGIGRFITNLWLDTSTGGALELPRIKPASELVSGYDINNIYLLKDHLGVRSWDLVSNIIPTSAGNLTVSTIPGSTVGYVYSGLVSSQYTFKPLISTGLQISDGSNDIRIESRVGLTSSTGIPIYKGLNTDYRHVFKNIISGSLDILESGDNVKIELHEDINDKSFYVNANYLGVEMGTLAKPYKTLARAIEEFIGDLSVYSKLQPEWGYRGKIVLLSNINTPSDPLDANYIDYLDVNLLTIDGNGFTLNYAGGKSYFISTRRIVNSTGAKDGTTQKLKYDINLTFRNLIIQSNKHGIVDHLNYCSPLDLTQQPTSSISFIGCKILDFGFLSESASYLLTPYFNFGSPVYAQNTLPSSEYVIKTENRGWNGEGNFTFKDCNVFASSTTAIYQKNTSDSWFNITISFQTEYVNYATASTPVTVLNNNYRLTPRLGIYFIFSEYTGSSTTWPTKSNYLRIEGFQEYSSDANTGSPNYYQIGGVEALFKLVSPTGNDSYFEIKNGYIYGENCNNLVILDPKFSLNLVDCDFSRFTSLDNTHGAFKLNTPTASQKGISLLNCTINNVKDPSVTPLQKVKPYSAFSIINGSLFSNIISGTSGLIPGNYYINGYNDIVYLP